MAQSASLTLRAENSFSDSRAKLRNAPASNSSSETPMMRQPGMKPALRQVEQARNQLAAREIARRADQHDDLRKTRTDPRWNLRHGALPCY